MDDAADAVTLLHLVECAVDVCDKLPVRDEFVHLQFASYVVVHQRRKLRAALDAAKGASFPHAASDKLEGWGEVNLLFERKERKMKGKEGKKKNARLVTISCPAAATPMIILVPHPL